MKSINPNAFNDAADVRTNSRSEFFELGRYLYRLDAVDIFPNRKKIDTFKAEFTCVHVLEEAPDGLPMNRVGQPCCVMSNQSSDYYVKEVKNVLCTAVGVASSDMGKDAILMLVGKDQDGNDSGEKPIDGAFIVVEVVTSQGKEIRDKPGEFFKNTNWVRAIPAAELIEILPESVQENYFTVQTDEGPQNILHTMLESE